MNYRQLLFSLALCLPLSVMARQIHVQSPHLSLVVNADEGHQPEYVYFGSRLSAADLQTLQKPQDGHMDAYPAYGMNCTAPSAFACRHADGNLSTQLVVTGSDTNGDVTTIHLKDPIYNLFVDLKYRTYADADMIETWTEITNKEKGTVTLTSFASAMLPIRRGNVWASHLTGEWATEAHVVEEPLNPGELVVGCHSGIHNTQPAHAEMMFSLDGKGRENSGDVIGAALCYGGNYKLRTVTDNTNYHYFFAGIDEENSEYHLKRGETFATPPVALTFSKEGLSGVSRNFHSWGRKYMLAHGDKERMILLNSWEGVYFGINEERMDQMMGDIADLGGELFVMDDGWFGDKYARKTEKTGLGDWVVDKEKLPHGIEGLIEDAKKLGVKFGIWIEPEMTNTRSELYEKHPDWIIKAPGREPTVGRGGTQLVLDLSNPKVQDFVFSVVDNLMTKYPEIAYIKWDANMDIMNHGSQYLSMDNQSHLYIDYYRGFAKALDRIRAKYPDLIMQDCASGGGRVNWGVLPWFDEFWTSDDTDALQRIFIQWGTSYFFPPMAMACHISASPNHQTSRVVPLKFRIDVAMSGRLGVEIQPKNMTDAEKTLCRNAIAEYKQIRPVVQMGNIYRLLSPYDKQGLASLMYVSDSKDKAVWYWWKWESYIGQHMPRVRMAGLDPTKRYKVHELNHIDKTPLDCEGKSYSGAYLMEHGLEMPANHDVNRNDRTTWSSRVLYLTAE
jgi:alpha-galactosidase